MLLPTLCMKTQQVKDYGSLVKVREGSIVYIGVSPLNPTQYRGDEKSVIVSRVLGKLWIESDNPDYPSGTFHLIEAEADDNGTKLVGWLTEVRVY